MRRIFLFLAVAGLLVAVGGAGWWVWTRETAPPVEWSADMQAVADGNNAFGLELYSKLREEKKGNLVFSPYSAHTCLSMAATGANGNTRDQMVKTLHLPPKEDKQLAAGDLGRFYGHPRKDYELAVANALWGRKGISWRPEFLDTQKKRFGSEFREADFATNPDGERQRINTWVESQTRDRIKNLLQEGTVTPDTTLVLVNAVYFKGRWAEQFKPQNTRDQDFHYANGTNVQVPMMHNSLTCGFAEREGVTLGSLPYKGGELSMVVIVPKEAGGLPSLERSLTAETLAAMLSELRDEKDVSVTLPKFRIESSFVLGEPLAALGTRDAFDPSRADFSRMSEPSPGYVSHVVQKAFVEVNEEGTEAAAATGATFSKVSAPAQPKALVADRPFLFLIRDTARGTILFLGRVEKP